MAEFSVFEPSYPQPEANERACVARRIGLTEVLVNGCNSGLFTRAQVRS
jgi:hypothetical protein